MEKNERKKEKTRAREEGGKKTQSWTESAKKKWLGWFAKVNKKRNMKGNEE